MPDDEEWFDSIDPVLKLYMYESWIKDQEEKNEFAKSYTILGGYFTNPQLASKMANNGNSTFESSDEDYERVSEQMLKENREKENKKKKRRRLRK